MGGCFSKKRSGSNNVVTPTDPQFDLPENAMKKEVFAIKHRISHEIDQGISEAPTSKLSRSKSSGAQNPNRRRRRHSRSKRSFDFDLNTRINNANEDFNALETECSRRREERRCSTKERRISISPSRRSLSPSPAPSPSPSPSLHSVKPSTSRPPARMVSVPATHKTNSGGAVKRIHVKRNVSPASRTSLCVYRETQSQQESNTRVPDQRRKSLVQIDNNASPRKLSRYLYDPSPPTYATMLLEDIHNFHQKNTRHPATSPPAFAVPECVNKAYSIMEAVADLNSNTRCRNPTSLISLSAATRLQECQKPDSTNSPNREC